MKKNNFICVIAVCISLFNSSCEKFLEETPKTFLAPDNFFTTYEECKMVVNGCYQLMAKQSMTYGNFAGGDFIGMVLTDEMQWNPANGNVFKEISFGQHNAGNPHVYTIWQIGYRIIDACNQAIKGIEGAPIGDEEKKSLIAEAKFIRALFYLRLLSLYGDIPLVLTPAASMDNNEVPQAQATEVIEHILQDLVFAESNLPKMQSEVGRATRGAAKMLHAKAAMQFAGFPYYQNDKWQVALDKCQEVLTDNEYGYALEANYGDVFIESNENNPEVIFDIQYEEGTLLGSNLGVYYFGETGNQTRGGSPAIMFLVDEFATSYAQDDLRKNWVVGDYQLNAAGVKVYNIARGSWRNSKYKRSNPSLTFNAGGGNYIVMRYADLLLMAAEALNEVNGGPNQQAYEYMNMVRRRAYGVPTETPNEAADLKNLDKEAFFEAIIMERSWELAGEGWRWFDLKRWHNMVERVRATSAEVAPIISDKLYYLPIPLKELQANPNLKQSEGWK